MITEEKIREQLFSYLSREMSLDQFEQWLVQQSWNMHRDSAQAAQTLVAAIELRLAEHREGHLPKDDLDSELRGLLARPYIASAGVIQEVGTRWVATSRSTEVTVAVALAA